LPETKQLYHISSHVLELGAQPIINRPRTKKGEREEKENNLEHYRPHDKPSRKTSYFAFGNIADAISFADAEESLQKGRRNLYKVEMYVEHRAPMALASAARSTHPQLEALVREYWNPTKPWHMWEYLGSFVNVLAHLDEPTEEIASAGLSRMTQDKVHIRQQFGEW